MKVSARRNAQFDQDVIVDLARRAIVPSPLWGVRAEQAGSVYVLLSEWVRPPDDLDSRSTERVWLWNVATGEQRYVGMANTRARVDHLAEDLVHDKGWLVDLGTGTVLGMVTKAPLGLDARGRGLYPVRPRPQEAGVPLGPVRWASATQPAATNSPATSAPSP